MKEYTAEDLLEARERRAEFIDALLKRYQTPLLVMRVNYPGLKKTNDLTLAIIYDISALICKMLGARISYKSMQISAEGPIFLAVVKEEAIALKTTVVDLEERHTLGRCLDLDVYDSSGRSISRQELGYPRRKCYLCEDYAQHCVRARRHREHEVIEYIQERFRNYTEYGDNAKQTSEMERT